MKKILLLLLGGVLFMTTVTGCSNTPNEKSKKEIEGLFSDFMTVFQADNYEFLYDKEGDDSNLPEGDLGSWVLTTNMYQEIEGQSKRVGIQLVFNKNLRQCRGQFTVDEIKYPILYKNNGIELIDSSIDTDIKTELSNFKLLYDVLSLDETCLNSLKSERYFYNDEVPLYGTSYYLPVNDANVNALKNVYTNFSFNEEVATLKFEGKGHLWNTNSNVFLDVLFDKEGKNYFSASLNFNESEAFDNLFEKE